MEDVERRIVFIGDGLGVCAGCRTAERRHSTDYAAVIGNSASQCQAADFGGNEVLAQVGIDLGLFDIGVAEEAL